MTADNVELTVPTRLYVVVLRHRGFILSFLNTGYRRLFSWGIRWAKREADHAPDFGAEVKSLPFVFKHIGLLCAASHLLQEGIGQNILPETVLPSP